VSHIRSESGQASVEAVAIVPLVLLVATLAWQLVLTGHTLWLAAGAARAAARAELVGESPARAARSALPRSLERGMSVKRVNAGGVRVEVRLPLMVRSWGSPIEIAAASSLGER
jgi:hypothetical protein